MNIKFLNKEKLKKAAPIVIAGTMAMTSVIGLTGCCEDLGCDDYVIVNLEDNSRVVGFTYHSRGYNYFVDCTGARFCLDEEHETENGSICKIDGISKLDIVSTTPLSTIVTKEDLDEKGNCKVSLIELQDRLNNQENHYDVKTKTK